MKHSKEVKTNKFQGVVLVDPLQESESKHQGVVKKWDNGDLIFIYESHSIIYALVNKIVNRIANGGYEWIKDDEAIKDNITQQIEDIFSGTSGNTSLLLQMREMVQSLIVTGDTYIEKVSFNPRVVKLDTISPKYMRKKVSKTGEIMNYIQQYNGRTVVSWEPDEMYNESLNNSSVYGVGRVEAIMREIQADLGAIVFNTKFFENSAMPSSIFILKPEVGNMTKEQQKQLKKQLLQSYQGAMNSGKPIMNNLIEKVEVITRDLDKMQFIESRDKFIEKACSAFDMSKAMIGITDSANEATSSQTMKQEFYLNAVRPYEQIVERFINDEILPDLGFEDYKLHILEQSFVDEQTKIDAIIKQRDSGLITTNQARAMLNLPPIEEEWADQLNVRTAQGFVSAIPQDMPLEQSTNKSVFNKIKALFDGKKDNQE